MRKSVAGLNRPDIRGIIFYTMNTNYLFSESDARKAQTYTFDFYRENNGRWYIDFPEFINGGYGSKANLQMVAGADKMLEGLAPNGKVTLTFSNRITENYKFCLKRIFADPWGATYVINRFPFKRVWLCNVSKFIFQGSHPKLIYVSVVG